MARRFRTTAVLGCTLGIAVALLAAPVEARTAREASSPSMQDPESREHKAKPRRTCQGKRATIVGTRRSNTLIGTPRRDVIWAGAGADNILGRGGNDLICGGKGADALIGGPGRDKLYGQAKPDYCHGEKREHRNHYRCEVHLNPRGSVVNPPNAPRKAPPYATEAPANAPTAKALRQRAAGYFGTDYPVCVPDGSALTTVRLGNAYFQSAYTNPGWIAVMPYYYRWGSSEFTDGPYFRENWKLLDAPADGQTYSRNMGSALVPRSDRIFMMYYVYWWNGAQWVEGTAYQVQHHYLQTTSGLVYSGGMCMV